MGPFETAVLIVAIIMAAKVLTARFGMKEDEEGNVVPIDKADTEELRAEMRKLKERVAVLERLATDSSSALAREIDNLR